jgi:hypothetical protein
LTPLGQLAKLISVRREGLSSKGTTMVKFAKCGRDILATAAVIISLAGWWLCVVGELAK